jgi:myo-inositol 2-dehydrogenase/D-chiro-inositol 1-dehydrogenase
MEKSDNQGVSRRGFLSSAVKVGTVGALATGTILSACGDSAISYEDLGLPEMLDKAPAGRKLKAGLVGCGNRGTGAALNFLAAGDGLEIVALADVFEDKLTECRNKLADKGAKVSENQCFVGFDAYQKLIDLADVDVVLLATPPHFRPEHFEACVKAKKPTFMEKPIAVDPVGIRKILASSKKAEAFKLNVVCGTQRRHQRDYVASFAQIANGAIGQILSAKAYWNQAHLWYNERKPGQTDMEHMMRNWSNFTWLSGDHIVEQHVHNIDVINWFAQKTPKFAIGYGSRQRRITGDQYDNFSVDFDYGNGFSMHSMCRQIDDCANGIGEVIVGTKGLITLSDINPHRIFDFKGNVLWEYDYPKNEKGESTGRVKLTPYIQEHVDWVTAIRTGGYINDAEACAYSTLTGIMGRTAAYTGKKVTWEQMMKSDMRLGPAEYHMGDLDMTFEVPVPGAAVKTTSTIDNDQQ